MIVSVSMPMRNRPRAIVACLDVMANRSAATELGAASSALQLPFETRPRSLTRPPATA